jgi:elongation factor G
MEVEVVAPQEYIGDVIRDLGRRESNITGVGLLVAGVQVITTQVPLARMFRYATSLRSLTHGRGTFAMSFSRYQPVRREALQKAMAPATA